MSAPALSRYLDRLVASRWLRREGDPADGRRVRLVVTPDGDHVLRSVRYQRAAWLADRLDALPESELEAIDRAIGPLMRLIESGDRASH
jgi:DNA-binding MarR family transcriptional regulator